MTPPADRQPSNDPLHGLTLEKLLTRLVEHYGWAELGQRIDIRCFNYDPSIKSSLQFLRKTPWARKKVEDLYVDTPSIATGTSPVNEQPFDSPPSP